MGIGIEFVRITQKEGVIGWDERISTTSAFIFRYLIYVQGRL